MTSLFSSGLRLLCCFVLLAMAPLSYGETACGPIRVLTPDQQAVNWTEVDGASAYRLRIEVRTPEGALTKVIDTRTSTPRFPVSGLPHGLVMVRVTPECGTVLGASSESRFMLGANAACSSPSNLNVMRRDDALELHWKSKGNAKYFEVSAFTVTDGALLVRQTAHEPRARIDLKGEQTAVVAVRAHCATGFGDTVYRVVSSD